MARQTISFRIEGGDAEGKGGHLVLSPDVLLYDEFKAVYDADTSEGKILAFLDLKYVKLLGEEVGAFSHLDGHERQYAVTLETYGVPDPRLTKPRRELRDKALTTFREFEESEEGQVLEMINSRIQIIRRALKATEKDVGEFLGKPQAELDKYLEDTGKQTKNLLSLIQEKNKVLEQIAKQGGRKLVRNQGGKVSSANDQGVFRKDALMQRIGERRVAEEATTPTPTS